MTIYRNYYCNKIIDEIWARMSADVYDCPDSIWQYRNTYALGLTRGGVGDADCYLQNKCIQPCPYQGNRLKLRYLKYQEGNYTVHKGIVFFEEGGFLTDEQLLGENYIDIVYTCIVKTDANGNVVEKKIETIWGTGGRKIIVNYVIYPVVYQIFSCLADRVKDNINLLTLP